MKTPALKVYGWTGCRREAVRHGRGGAQTCEICATSSMAEVARLDGKRAPWELFCLCETGNAEEIAIAQAHSRTILWRQLDDRGSWTVAPARVRP